MNKVLIDKKIIEIYLNKKTYKVSLSTLVFILDTLCCDKINTKPYSLTKIMKRLNLFDHDFLRRLEQLN